MPSWVCLTSSILHLPVLQLYGFTSARKMSCVVVHRPDGGLRVLNKGAAEWVIRKCSGHMDQTGAIVPMTADKKVELEASVTAMANRGLRCIALSIADISAQDFATLPAEYWEDVSNLDRCVLVCLINPAL